MFFVGVIKDNTNSCQHAITIFRIWIYDSNEPFLALPLSKECLDCCTWEIKVARSKMLLCLYVSLMDGFSKNKKQRRKKYWICVQILVMLSRLELVTNE
jgi:hypothetical protein